MTFSEYLNKHWLTIVQLAKETGQSRQTLENWYNNPKKRRVIELVVNGLKYEAEKY